MSKAPQQAGAFGLDVGTSRVVLAQQNEGGRYDYRSQLNAFVTLPCATVSACPVRPIAVCGETLPCEAVIPCPVRATVTSEPKPGLLLCASASGCPVRTGTTRFSISEGEK